MRIGVLLGGCGMYDGTDVHEAVLTLLALESAGERPTLLAPAVSLDRVVDHLSGDQIPGEAREVLKESARLARGRIYGLEQSRPQDLEALIIPGGYGPVVNFCTGFATPGVRRELIPEIDRFIRHFLDAGKPMGLISLGEVPVRTILGQEMEVAPPPPDPRQVMVDRERRIVHTPGFTVFTRLRDVQAGIETMVSEVLRLIEERGHAGAVGGAAGGVEKG